MWVTIFEDYYKLHLFPIAIAKNLQLHCLTGRPVSLPDEQDVRFLCKQSSEAERLTGRN